MGILGLRVLHAPGWRMHVGSPSAGRTADYSRMWTTGSDLLFEAQIGLSREEFVWMIGEPAALAVAYRLCSSNAPPWSRHSSFSGVVFLIPIRTCVHRIPRTGASYGRDGDAARDVLLSNLYQYEQRRSAQGAMEGRENKENTVFMQPHSSSINGSQMTRKSPYLFMIGLAVVILAGP